MKTETSVYKKDTDSAVRTCAKPIERKHRTQVSKAVLGLHGYTGYPGELFLPLDLLFKEGFDVYAPRYPGHGTNGEDFLKTTMKDWAASAERTYQRLTERYDEVYLIGHSMGGLIATHLASMHPVQRMVLYAPALVLQQKIPLQLLDLIRLFRKRSPVAWQRDSSYPLYGKRDEDDDQFLGKEYWSYRYYRQIASLERLRRQVLLELPDILTDTLVFTAGNDALIAKETGPLVQDGMKGENNRWVHLEGGTHLIPYDRDDASRQMAMQETLLFLGS